MPILWFKKRKSLDFRYKMNNKNENLSPRLRGGILGKKISEICVEHLVPGNPGLLFETLEEPRAADTEIGRDLIKVFRCRAQFVSKLMPLFAAQTNPIFVKRTFTFSHDPY